MIDSKLKLPKLFARKAGFANHRKYLYNGKTIDEQVHLGIDLASTAHSPVPAANNGRVAFAQNTGIYGKTVSWIMVSVFSACMDILAESRLKEIR